MHLRNHISLSAWRGALPDSRRDLRHALRIVRRNPGYAVASMVCLGLGMGVNATVYSLFDGLYFRRLPLPQSERVVAIDRDGTMPVYWRDYLAFRGNLHTLSGLAASQARGTFMDVERANFAIVAETVSANYAGVLRVKAALGRWFSPANEAPGAEPTVVISGHVWESHFHRDPAVLGKYVWIEAQRCRVIGVAPDGFRGTSPPMLIDAWLPLTTFPIFRPQLAVPRGPGPQVSLIGRLAAGEALEQAVAEIAVLDARLRQTYPRLADYTKPMEIRLFRGIMSPNSRRALRPIAVLLFFVVATVLLIACVDVANLLLSRAAVRRREMAVRRSLGASPGRLIRQGLAESVILALGGAGLGILLGYWAAGALAYGLPASIPQSIVGGIDLEMNWRVAACTAAVTLVCAILFSLAPALEGSSVDLVSALKRDVRSGQGGRWRQQDLYVVAQVALSLALLIGTGLLLRALQRTTQIDPGFATDRRIYIRLFTPARDFTPEISTHLFTRLLEEARRLPGVEDATLSFAVLGFMDSECISSRGAAPESRSGINVVEPNYFEMMGVPLLRGRNFAAWDGPQSPRVVIVNETLARQRWPGQDPIGKILSLGCADRRDPKTRAEVIGVAQDSKYGALDEKPIPFLYVSRFQVWWGGFFALVVRTAGDPHALTVPLIRLARSSGPNVRTYELRTFGELTALSLWQVRWQAALLGAFSLLAIALSVVGLYSVVAYTVAQRTQEIGVRMALGAQKHDMQWMVISHGLRLTAVGIVVGLVASGALTRFLHGFLYGISPLEPVAFAGAVLAWVFVATLASYLPARRAARVDPAISLRYE